MPEIVHGLWIGNHLSLLELLCLHSFTAKGYSFHLWTYEALDNTLPKGVELKDANEIIPKEIGDRVAREKLKKHKQN